MRLRVAAAGVGAVLTAQLLAAAGLAVVAEPVGAATFNPTPDPTVDGSSGSLRAAVVGATNVGGDTIVLQAGGTYTLTCAGGGELLHGNTPLTIDGNGATIRQTCPSNRVFEQGTSAITFDRVTLTGGVAPGGGGAISASGSVTVTNSVITGNMTAIGGAGGGINAASVSIVNSTITNNTSPTSGLGGGGGVAVTGSGPLSVTNSTIANNTAPAGGGLSTNPGVAMTVTNSTITGNTATGLGGGIAALGDVTLVYSTVTENHAPQGANANGGVKNTLTGFGSVVALPQGGGANCAQFTSAPSNGFNFSDDTSCSFNAATDKQNAGNPLLGPLANNGGPTQTMLPQDGPSPLIDAIPSAHCQDDGASGITTDQRGFPRPDSGSPNCDIGAVEVQPALAPTPVAVTPRFTG